ncbi:MAG: GPR endopeptidase [Lachnospiraceae bacterium]|nr:GPR endopeptidase [Lachnospiraceae bacterium]
MDKYQIKTDLALESKESFSGTEVEIPGVSIDENIYGGVKATRVDIFTQEGADLMRKPIGRYITLEMKSEELEEERGNIIEVLAREIKKLLPKDNDGPILVVGLGNREVTPDALGPKVAGELNISRHLIDNGGVCAVVPGVMAQSGMESAEIVKGIVEEIGVKCVIAIDSLAARSVRRLCNTIQLTNTGITPGSGVGNYRSGLNEETIEVPVIAIGVPMVVDAATIVLDTMDALIKVLSESPAFNGIGESLDTFSDKDKYELVKELLEPQIGTLYVTPKDIDENVITMGRIVSEAINKATNGNNISTF